MNSKGKILLSFLTRIVVLTQLCLIALPVTVKADTTSIFTDNLPEITQVTDEAGFTHPGVGLTKELLENVRSKVRSGAQPWTYYFNSMLLPSPDASKTITSSNSSDGATPNANYFNSQGIEARFIADGIKAYTQAFMYFMTGDEIYRANAMMIIRIWEQMDPTKYVYYTDAHIHAGVPLNRMVMAAEILRYTSYQTASLAWTDQDTTNFTNNLIVPVTETFLHDQNHFMNQHTYPLLGAMAGYIFTGNRARYNEAVEWFTVNRTANDQGLNGSVKALFRLVTEEEKPGIHVGEGTPIAEPHVQQMEMGRDQAHGGGDLTNSAMITRLIHAQGTKVDPVAGTPSTADNAVDVMDFMDNRILGAADYFWHFMLGYDTVWTPQAYAITGGDPDHVGMGGYIRDTYNDLSDGYKGRFATANFWDFYSYYTYVKHEDVSKIAPYYYEAFTKKLQPTPDGWHNTDAGNDFWLYLPPEAEADAAKFIPQNKSAGTIYELADRYTNLTKLDNSKPAVKDNDNNNAIKDTNNIDTSAVTTMTEGDTSFIRFFAKEEGTRIAYLSSGLNTSATYELRIRTNGVATLNTMGKSVSLPDTKGEWKYFPVSGAPGDFDVITVSGASGIIVDIDHINTANLTPPTFNTGNTDMNVYTYVGASVYLDFSATDSSSTDVITYGLQNNPVGSAIDSGTGAFSWQPTAGGNNSLIVTATDGTTITTKNVNIIVGSDRASAVQAASAAYDANAIYEKASLANYQTVYNNTMNMISTASDVDFDKQLQALVTATEGLRLMTPLSSLGSMLWSQVAYWSSWGNYAIGLDDGSGSGGGSYRLALGTPPHLYHLIDFGPDYKISAYRFGFKASIFADRIANSTVYASNDKINWTRITPGVSAYTQAYNTIDVAPEFQNVKYRYIKLEMVQPLPDVLYGVVRNFLEPRGFTIYGTRYDVDNKLQSISLSSDQALNGRVALGGTVKVSITAKEAIQNVKVKIQGVDATVSTTDNINWTAMATMSQGVATGPVTFSIDYQRSDGTNGDTMYSTTDNSNLFLVDESDLIRNVPGITNLIDSTSGRTAATTLQIVNNLFDSNAGTVSDFRNGSSGSGWGSYIIFDFREGNQVALSSVELLASQGNYYSRIGGTVIQGSNDNAIWTTLTNAAASTINWQMLPSNDSISSYRYIRIYNPNQWYGNMAEVRFHGVVKHLSKIASASISSAQSINQRIVPGNTVKLAFTSTEAISNVNVTIQGQAATVSSSDNINWTAVATLNQGVAAGSVNFAINYNQQDGSIGFPIHSTTDNSSLFLVDESNVIKNIPGIANLIDSTTGRSASTTLQIVNYLFDSNAGTVSDFRNGSSGSGTGSYIIFDFKSGNQATLTSVELLSGQSNYYTRINGTVVQGSNDNKTWTTLTTAAVSTTNWQTLAVSSKVPYRYIKIYNPNTWFGNMAELRLHGAVKPADVTPPVTTDNAPQGWVNQNTTVSLIAVDDSSGVAATYYTVDGGSKQTGNSVTLTTDGTHTIVYWSVDWAGNVEQPHTVTVNMDKTAPVTTAAVDPAAPDSSNGWYGHAVTVSFGVYDNLSGVAKTEISLDGRLTWQPYTTAITIDKEGKNTVSYRSTDNAGNVEAVKTVNVNLDLTTPVTKAAVSPAAPDGQNGWYVHPVTVTLSAYDDLSGVAKTEYSLDGGRTWQSYTNPVTFNQDDKYTVTYRSTDNVGNVEAAQTISFNLDATAPVTVATPSQPDGANGWYAHQATVSLSATDNLAGVSKTEYSLDGGTTWQTYASAITFDKEGKYTVNYRSTDNAGNVETAKTVDINLDSTPPVTTAAVSPAAPDGQNGWYVHPVTVTSSAYDDLSGVGKTEYSLDGGGTWQSYAAPVTLSQDSKYTLSYRSADIAGNVEVEKMIAFNLDSTAPTITVSGLVYGTYSDSMDITPVFTLSDNLSGVDSGKTTVTLSTYGVQQTVQQGVTIPLYTLPLGSHTYIVTTSDMAGNTSSQTVLFQTTTNIQSMQALVTRFTNMGWIDNAGIVNSLQSKLAANALADFVNEVQAQSGKHISARAVGYLLRDAQYLLTK